MAESLFFSFSANRPWPKCSFLLLSGKNKLGVCNPFVYGQCKHFYSMGIYISSSIKNGIIGSSRHWEISENGNNYASGHPERVKFGKTVFRDAPTSCFLWKWTVGESRSLKISENKLSGSPEARKIWKAGSRGAPKHENNEKRYQIKNFLTIALSRTDGMRPLQKSFYTQKLLLIINELYLWFRYLYEVLQRFRDV